MTRLLLAAGLLAFAPAGHADCGELANRLSKSLGYPEVESGFRADCRVWPADPTRTIVVLAHLQTPRGSTTRPVDIFPAEGYEDGEYDLDVLVVRTDTGAILQRLLQRGALSSDSLRLDTVTIDTGRYSLAQGVRAFGVRARRATNTAEIVNIRLYVVAGQTLQQVFGPAFVLESFSETQLANDCHRSSMVERTLAIARSSSRGYADLIVQEKTTTEEPGEANDGCAINVTRWSNRYLVRYDGKTYVLPEALRTSY